MLGGANAAVFDWMYGLTLEGVLRRTHDRTVEIVTGMAGGPGRLVKATRVAVQARGHARTLSTIRAQYQNIRAELDEFDHFSTARLENTGRLRTGSDHVNELTDFANGLRSSTTKLKGMLGDSNLSPAMRAEVSEMLSRTSKLLDGINAAIRK